jgi:hypothetical protein
LLQTTTEQQISPIRHKAKGMSLELFWLFPLCGIDVRHSFVGFGR